MQTSVYIHHEMVSLHENTPGAYLDEVLSHVQRYRATVPVSPVSTAPLSPSPEACLASPTPTQGPEAHRWPLGDPGVLKLAKWQWTARKNSSIQQVYVLPCKRDKRTIEKPKPCSAVYDAERLGIHRYMHVPWYILKKGPRGRLVCPLCSLSPGAPWKRVPCRGCLSPSTSWKGSQGKTCPSSV